MDAVAEVAALEAQLAATADPARAAQEKAYMKSAMAFHGAPAARLKEVAAAWLKRHPRLTREELRALLDAAYDTPWFDLRTLALVILMRKERLLGGEDAAWVEALVRRSACWAHVDALATHVAAGVLRRHPGMDADLRRWAVDEDLWVRRLALLSDLAELRAGRGDFARFEELSVPMLGEREFFIRKAIGWVLRDTSRKRPELVRAYVARHGPQMSGLTRREATRLLPAS
jgi:3-methyladenine DNA glycosylase AlkD